MNLITLTLLTLSQHDHEAPASVGVLTALVVDTGCYVSHNSKGEKHRTCATNCAKSGVPLALLDEATGTLYLPIASDHQNPNTKLMPFIEKKVRVTGTPMEKGGLKGFAIKTVEAASQ
ncbi:MAG: hypothetical protein K2X03_29870 [Bryobacteraceae bacterium]|nr:hypothetical protein [Bryobacteraceae bacterium]